VGRDSSVGMATRYGLKSTGIQCRWKRDLPHPFRLVLGPTQPSVQWETNLLSGERIGQCVAWPWPLTSIERRG